MSLRTTDLSIKLSVAPNNQDKTLKLMIMKKILLLISLISILITSCTSEEPVMSDLTKPQDTEFVSLKNDSTIILLSNLNDSLISNNSQSRGFWSVFKRVCKIAFADIKGAVTGFKLGGTFGPTGAWIGATVVGIGSSASAYNDSRAPSFVRQSDIEAAYTLTVCDPNFESNKALIGERVKIDIPIEHVSSVELGKIHNLTLNTLKKEDLSTIQVENGFTKEELSVIHSDKFQSEYSNYMNNSSSFELEYILSSPTKEEYIIQLFLDLYKNYPNDIQDVNYIINEYIHIIEQDPTITNDEKNIIYTAIAMAGYSTDYWDQTMNP